MTKPRTRAEIQAHARRAKEEGRGIISNPFWLHEGDGARHDLWAAAYLGQDITDGEDPDEMVADITPDEEAGDDAPFPKTLFDT